MRSFPVMLKIKTKPLFSGIINLYLASKFSFSVLSISLVWPSTCPIEEGNPSCKIAVVPE